jgi:hypothetical protein
MLRQAKILRPNIGRLQLYRMNWARVPRVIPADRHDLAPSLRPMPWFIATIVFWIGPAALADPAIYEILAPAPDL